LAQARKVHTKNSEKASESENISWNFYYTQVGSAEGQFCLLVVRRRFSKHLTFCAGKKYVITAAK